jgi:hypothetical protein
MQVDGQGRDADQRLVDLDELLDNVAIFTDKDATGKTEVSVEPRVPDTTSVGLDTNLKKPDLLLLGDGLDAEARRVGMCADNGDGVARAPLSANGEGDDGGAVAGQVVFAAGADDGSPGVPFFDQFEAGLFESLRGGADGMVSWSSIGWSVWHR